MAIDRRNNLFDRNAYKILKDISKENKTIGPTQHFSKKEISESMIDKLIEFTRKIMKIEKNNG